MEQEKNKQHSLTWQPLLQLHLRSRESVDAGVGRAQGEGQGGQGGEGGRAGGWGQAALRWRSRGSSRTLPPTLNTLPPHFSHTHHNPHSLAVTLVPHVRHALQRLVLHQLSNLLNNFRLRFSKIRVETKKMSGIGARSRFDRTSFPPLLQGDRTALMP